MMTREMNFGSLVTISGYCGKILEENLFRFLGFPRVFAGLTSGLELNQKLRDTEKLPVGKSMTKKNAL